MARTKKRTGPAPWPAKLVRSLRVHVPVNEAEHKAIVKAAGGKDVAAWSRRVLLEAAKGAPREE
jgi:hypothetical protein